MIFICKSKTKRTKVEFCVGDNIVFFNPNEDKISPIMLIYKNENEMIMVANPWKFKKYQRLCKSMAAK